MSSKHYFSYVRVSTQRQGQTGTSLAEQLAAIKRYAAHWNLKIIKQFEEQETAAKQGRPVFLEMIRSLKKGEADGVVIHKIDRSARNLKDWADLGALIDSGIEVHFANESIDLSSRGGRLSADIQAVVAADYIRNLREEVKKGFYGRLKQGLYPLPAPLGYIDVGQGKPKEPHPLNAPLIKKAFELYATGKWSILALTRKMEELGLRNRNNNPVSKNGINWMLKNRFYCGLIELEKTSEIFAGQHEPLITQSLFDRVQMIMAGKKVDKQKRHFFVFRRLVECKACSRKLVPEKQKGYVYYRCHTANCRQKTIREERIENAFLEVIKKLRFSEQENQYLKKILLKEESKSASFKENQKQALMMRLEQCRTRLSKLTDVFLDGNLEHELFVTKKNDLVVEENRLKEGLNKLENNEEVDALAEVRKILEQANQAYLSYKSAIELEKREMVEICTSNFWTMGKTVVIKLNYPFQLIVNRHHGTNGGPLRDTPRTDSSSLSRLLKNLLRFFEAPG
jgi:DNA invertase Pin-like site-specific DNA recombinase